MNEYVVIGNGVAGTTAAEHIRKNDSEGRITIVTDEASPFYFRVRLPDVISGEVDESVLLAKDERWYEDQRMDLKLSTEVVSADPDEKTLFTREGVAIPYDRLLVATGGIPFVPPLKGADRRGVFVLRTLRDAGEITAYPVGTDDVVIVGGGLLGIEAGFALRRRGRRVTLVEVAERLLPRQLDPRGAAKLQSIMEEIGFSVRLDERVAEFVGSEAVDGVRLASGETLPASLVVMSAGVRPSLGLAGPLGLACDRGIAVDERMRTSRPDVFAAGDAVEYRGTLYGLWIAAMEQGKVAGINMAGGASVYEGTAMVTRLKVAGVELASAGDIDAEDRCESMVVETDRVYRKLVLKGETVAGCIMLGDTGGFQRIASAIRKKERWQLPEAALFGWRP